MAKLPPITGDVTTPLRVGDRIQGVSSREYGVVTKVYSTGHVDARRDTGFDWPPRLPRDRFYLVQRYYRPNYRPNPAEGDTVALQQVQHKNTGIIATVLCNSEGFYWLKAEGDDEPFTSSSDLWQTVLPQTGDVWKSGLTEYRVLGVDPVNNTYLLILKGDYAEGGWPLPFGVAHQTEAEIDGTSALFVRRYPDKSLIFHSRLG